MNVDLSLSLGQVAELLPGFLRNKRNILLVGQPGCGKSDILSQAAQSLGWPLMLLHGSIRQPIDERGLPAVVDGQAVWLPYGDLLAMIQADAPLVVCYDDLGQTPPSEQAAIMQILLARQIDGNRISDHVRFCSATNRQSDRAGVTGIIQPLLGRFAAIIEVRPSADAWCIWADRQDDIPPVWLAFAQRFPSLFDEWKPGQGLENTMTPRTFAEAGRLYNDGLPDSVRFPILAGAIGRVWAQQLETFLRETTLPALVDIVADPSNHPIDYPPHVLYAIARQMARVGPQTLGAALTWLDRLPQQEYAVLAVKLILDCWKDETEPDRRESRRLRAMAVDHTAAMIAWKLAHADSF